MTAVAEEFVYGSQEPSTMHLPPGESSDDAVELARIAGLTLDPWQELVLRESARTVADPHNPEMWSWSAFEVCCLLPRQNGKTHLAVARILAGALLYDEKLILVSAHEYRTVIEMYRVLVEVCKTDEIAPHVRKIRTAAGSETVEFVNGCRVKFHARTKSSGRGMSPDCVIMDEALYLGEDTVAALMPGLSARPNPQIFLLSSAGTYESEVLLRLRRRGHTRAPGALAFFEWAADPTDDPDDPATWAKANPAFGRRIRPSAVQRERDSLSKVAFLRERLGVWSESAAEAVLSEDDILAVVCEPSEPPETIVALGFDVAWDRSGFAIAAAWLDADDVPHVALVDSGPGIGGAIDRLAQLSSRFYVPTFYDKRGGIVDVVERAERTYTDVRGKGLNGEEYAAGCADYKQLVVDHELRVDRAAPLVNDMTSASGRNFGLNGWVWDRKTSTPPTALIAATAALRGLRSEFTHTPGVF